ncbi:MAG: alpha/beta fold hydrolase [Planctomycetota bacterium]
MIETRTIAVGATRLAVHLCGEGPLALLIHGYPLDHRMWTDVLLGPLGQHRTLCALDLRGHGHSPWHGDTAHTMELLAEDCAAVIRTLGDGSADGTADVVGLSMGGYVALALAERHPETLRTLTLVDTRAAADTPEGKTARATMAEQVLQKGRRWLAEQLLPKLLAKDAAPQVQARMQTMIEATPVETILADLAGMRERKNRRGVLPQLQAPTFVVVGEHDALTPPAEAEAMAKEIPGAQLLVVPGAGHMTPMEQPVQFQEELGRFWGVVT